MKKIFATIFLAAALVLAVGQSSQAEAAEVSVGSYSDGTAVYLLTQTVSKKTWLRSYGYKCTVRAGRDYLDYTFAYVNERIGEPRHWEYDNSEGYSGVVYDGSSPVAANICNYLRNNYPYDGGA